MEAKESPKPISQLAKDVIDRLRKGYPYLNIQTPDPRETVRTVRRANGTSDRPAQLWTCVTGATVLSGDAPPCAGPDDAPQLMLSSALALPPGALLFVIVPDTMAEPSNFWSNPYTVQAAANLRDEFKRDGRCLIILSIDGKLPPMLQDDIPLLIDPLPDRDALSSLAQKVVADQNSELASQRKPALPTSTEMIRSAGNLCAGMTRFAAEGAICCALSTSRGIDLPKLAQSQKSIIEQSSERGLTFERGIETFSDIGGLDSAKEFSSDLFNGRRPPTCIVRWEEIEKSIGGAAGDSSGVTQDQLGVMLDLMEDFRFVGIICIGIPGSGKSLMSKAMGNTHGRPALKLDMGGNKGQYVGTSEQKIRKTMSILHSFAGTGGAFFVATSNDLSIIPSALKRRFTLGTFFFDLPTPEERKSIWNINLIRFGITVDDSNPIPDDADWTGAEVRNCCDMADRFQIPLARAAKRIVPYAISAATELARMRSAAHGKYLSATHEGTYKQPDKPSTRAMSL